MRTKKEADPNGTTSFDQELLEKADNVDRAIAANQAKGNLESAMSGDQAGPATETAAAGPDPVITSTLGVLINAGVMYLHNSREWSDPGQEWKDAVAQLGARLIDKYLPDAAAQSSDEVALALLLAPWIFSNLMAKKHSENVEENVERNVQNVVAPETFPPTPKEAADIFEVSPD